MPTAQKKKFASKELIFYHFKKKSSLFMVINFYLEIKFDELV
jgi:hypothetical protein